MASAKVVFAIMLSERTIKSRTEIFFVCNILLVKLEWPLRDRFRNHLEWPEQQRPPR
jgi:hypothetical protein